MRKEGRRESASLTEGDSEQRNMTLSVILGAYIPACATGPQYVNLQLGLHTAL